MKLFKDFFNFALYLISDMKNFTYSFNKKQTTKKK